MKALLFPELREFPLVHGLTAFPMTSLTLESVSRRTSLTVELGMQSMHDSTIYAVNRCCTHEEFLDGYFRLKNRGIRVCLHLINGLPGETPEMMLASACEAARLRPDGIKLQMLHVIRGTKLADMYLSGGLELLDMESYIRIVTSQLDVLPPETVIERLTGDGDRSKLIAPSGLPIKSPS